MSILDIIIWSYTLILLIVILVGFRKGIKELLYGRRCLNYVEMDTGRIGQIVLSKSLDEGNINGKTISVNYQNKVGNTLFVSEDLAENLKAEYDNKKALFYMNSDEFNTLLHNKLLEFLMMVKSKTHIMIILILCFAAVIGIVFLYYKLNGMQTQIDYLVYIAKNPPIPVNKPGG